jgi:hypothetical protein
VGTGFVAVDQRATGKQAYDDGRLEESPDRHFGGDVGMARECRMVYVRWVGEVEVVPHRSVGLAARKAGQVSAETGQKGRR